MAKPEWGTKRTCQSCGARFYDFGRSPITCPVCNAVFDVETLARARRSRPTARLAEEAHEPAVVEAELPDEADAEVEDVGDDDAEETVVAGDAVADEEEEEEDHLIEDTADLGEDDDVSDVIEGDIDDDERH